MQPAMNTNRVVEGLIANLSRFVIFVPMTVNTTTKIIKQKTVIFGLFSHEMCMSPSRCCSCVLGVLLMYMFHVLFVGAYFAKRTL